MRKTIFAMAALAGLLFSSCENDSWEFPNYDHTAVYFAYQSPIRTITLGEDYYDTSLDNEHKFQIMATMGGVYSNDHDIAIDFKIDNTLCTDFVFKGTTDDVVPMPSNYYQLESNRIVIPSGKVIGGVTVKLTDEYFNDPMATKLNYVIPVVITGVTGADSILVGKPQEGVSAPNRLISTDWAVQPKDYVLYAVKYISKYHANYLRRGRDVYSGAINRTDVRHAAYVEKDEVVLNEFSTLGLNTVQWARPTQDADKNNVECNLKLSFDESGNCTVSSNSANVEASGTGRYVVKGDKNSWGGKDRDVLYLDYTVKYAGITCASKDTLVVRDRGVKAEWFNVTRK